LGEIALYEHRYDQAIELAMQGQVNNKNSTNFCFLKKFIYIANTN